MDNKEAQELSAKLMSTWREIDAIYFDYAKSVGLSYLSLVVLETIMNNENGCTQKEIVELLGLPKQTVNVIIKSFLDQGHVALKEVSTDRRNKEITLSVTGKAYAEKILGQMKAAELKAMESLTEHQRHEILGIIMTIKSTLKEQLLTQEKA